MKDPHNPFEWVLYTYAAAFLFMFCTIGMYINLVGVLVLK